MSSIQEQRKYQTGRILAQLLAQAERPGLSKRDSRSGESSTSRIVAFSSFSLRRGFPRLSETLACSKPG